MSNRKGSLLLAAKLLFAAMVLFFLIKTSQLKLSLLLGILHNPILLFGSVSLFLLMVVVNARRWYKLNIAQGIDISFIKTIFPTYLGTAFNSLLPGAVGGDFVRLYYLFKKMPEKKSGALLSILFDRLTGFAGIFVAVCIVAMPRMYFFSHDRRLFYFLLACLAFCMLGAILFFMSMLLPKRVGISAWLVRHFHHVRWIKPIVSFLDAVHIYRNSKWVLVECVLLSVVIQGLMVTTVLLIAKMMGFAAVSPFDYAIALAATQIANLIPLTPGGLGLGEMAFANTLLLLNPGVTAAYATIFLVYRLLGFLSYLPAVFYIVNIRPAKSARGRLIDAEQAPMG